MIFPTFNTKAVLSHWKL